MICIWLVVVNFALFSCSQAGNGLSQTNFFHFRKVALEVERGSSRQPREYFTAENTTKLASDVCEYNATCGFYLFDNYPEALTTFIKACECPEEQECLEDSMRLSRWFIYKCFDKEDKNTTETEPGRDITTTVPTRDAAARPRSYESDGRASNETVERELPEGIVAMMNGTDENETCGDNAFCGFDVIGGGYTRTGFVKICTCPDGYTCEYNCWEFLQSKYHGRKCIQASPSTATVATTTVATSAEKRAGYFHHEDL